MRLKYIASVPLAVLTPFLPLPGSCQTYCWEPGAYPLTHSTTHIQSVSPQVAIAGVTEVYIQGYCFGDTQGTGTITLNGEPITDVVSWTDAEIEFIPPSDATSGDLVVTSSTYGQDDTATEADCAHPYSFCGNDSINANFTIAAVSLPSLCCVPNTSPLVSYVSGVQDLPPPRPWWVQGTWYYNDGGETMTLTLTQGAEDTSNNTWTITGTAESNTTCGTFDVTGTLDQYGDLGLSIPCEGLNDNCMEWLLLGSGDVTSQGLGGGPGPCPAYPSWPQRNFVWSLSNWEGPYYSRIVPPLFKGQVDLPDYESPTGTGFVIKPHSGSQYPTFGAWYRTLPPYISNNTSFSRFVGRFVYEQSGTGATDTCWTQNPGGPTDQVIGVTGGGWFVNQNDIWEWDNIGIWSQGIDWYRGNVGTLPCGYAVAQDMYIDGRTGPVKYTTNELGFVIGATQIDSEVEIQGSSTPVDICTFYPSAHGKCKPYGSLP
ncbi:MAG TPA: IPT/TIG domain-containing protein [Candidatus Acidoferrales bacterium]|nr:IPT/TIG domain-containing protein [Candidatus Acidoferrales bacterium]